MRVSGYIIPLLFSPWRCADINIFRDDIARVRRFRRRDSKIMQTSSIPDAPLLMCHFLSPQIIIHIIVISGRRTANVFTSRTTLGQIDSRMHYSPSFQ